VVHEPLTRSSCRKKRFYRVLLPFVPWGAVSELWDRVDERSYIRDIWLLDHYLWALLSRFPSPMFTLVLLSTISVLTSVSR